MVYYAIMYHILPYHPVGMGRGFKMIKTKITVAALRLFLAHGYKYVSLVDVAKEVGITKGGIYHYFGSKEELLHATVQFLFDNVKVKFIELFSDERNLREILHAIIVEQEIDIYIKEVIGIREETCAINGEIFRLEIMQHFPNIYQRIDGDHLEICNAIKEKLEKSLHKGEISGELDLGALAIIILTILYGAKSMKILFHDGHNRRKIMETICRLIGLK